MPILVLFIYGINLGRNILELKLSEVGKWERGREQKVPGEKRCKNHAEETSSKGFDKIYRETVQKKSKNWSNPKYHLEQAKHSRKSHDYRGKNGGGGGAQIKKNW